MKTTILNIKPEGQGNLSVIVDAILDGTLDNIAQHTDIAIEEGFAAFGGMGNRPVVAIKLEFAKLEDATIERIVDTLREISGNVVKIKVDIR